MAVWFTLKIHLTIMDLTDQVEDGCVNLDIKVIVIGFTIVEHKFEGPAISRLASILYFESLRNKTFTCQRRARTGGQAWQAAGYRTRFVEKSAPSRLRRHHSDPLHIPLFTIHHCTGTIPWNVSQPLRNKLRFLRLDSTLILNRHARVHPRFLQIHLISNAVYYCVRISRYRNRQSDNPFAYSVSDMQIIIYNNFELYNNAIETMSDVNTICRQRLLNVLIKFDGLTTSYVHRNDSRKSSCNVTAAILENELKAVVTSLASTLQWCATEGHAWLLHLMCYGLPPAMVQDGRGKKLRLMNLRNPPGWSYQIYIAILTLPRMLQRSAWMRVLPLLVSISISMENTHSLTHRECIHARSCGSRDTRGETCTPARRCGARRKYCTTDANRARAAVRESTKRNYARECAKNPHDDADLHSRRNARSWLPPAAHGCQGWRGKRGGGRQGCKISRTGNGSRAPVHTPIARGYEPSGMALQSSPTGIRLLMNMSFQHRMRDY
ncbi:hypothetical protein HW555_007325 [Spodoptera exigua]|uniref:Uncharacterized protein n=1 Tax=Spodoptera exigua TaxID=7107 RepID=A0A835GGE3_SPOEX|nr:hypothetical protein HW555_007325 [Spodoptera exigua]